MRELNTDCVHYRGSRPCTPHKETGVICARCDRYERVRERVAIIKLGAMGDVVRTTALLPDILAKHPNARLTWFTLPESVEYLRQIEDVQTVVPLQESAAFAGSRPFDALYNFDNAAEGVALADTLPAHSRRGFKSGPSGLCEGVWLPGDPTLFELGLWDDLKRRNTRSYLSLLAASAGLSYSGSRPALHIPSDARKYAQDVLAALPRPLIGINTDSGTRWLRKQWNLPYVEQLAKALVMRGYGVVLLGGPNVAAFNETLRGRFPDHVSAPQTAGDVSAFSAVIAQLDLLLTGDTLAMHLAWAAGVPIVALFGPTSHAEIDLAQTDVKLYADELECLGCYLHACQVDPHCMDLLTPERVFALIESRLEQRHAAGTR